MPPGSPRLSFQHQTPSVGFSLEDLNDHNQVHDMTNTAAWVTELEEVHVDPPPIPQWYIDQILATMPLWATTISFLDFVVVSDISLNII